MKALSIKQPWAWLIVNGFKDVENRTWGTYFRGRIMIHASKSRPTKAEMKEAEAIFQSCGYGFANKFPTVNEFEYGGIIGTAVITDCIRNSDSPWHNADNFGFMIEKPVKTDFIPCNGRLGFFKPDLPDGSSVRPKKGSGR